MTFHPGDRYEKEGDICVVAKVTDGTVTLVHSKNGILNMTQQIAERSHEITTSNGAVFYPVVTAQPFTL